MAFLVFERVVENGTALLRPTGLHFQLAGHQLIYRAWDTQGRPINKGWKISADELIRLHTGGNETYATRRLIIDYDPKASWRIALVELLDVYAYTYGDAGRVTWTPLMLRLRGVHYEEREVTPQEKATIIAAIREEPDRSDDIVEFLYLRGDARKGSWAWGRNGSTNAVFIEGEHRDYFRSFF